MKDGFLKVAAITPEIHPADCRYNLQQILAAIPNDVCIAVFPELCLTGYTCGDLFFQRALLQGAEEALRSFLKETSKLDTVCVLGVPVSHGAALYNCAAVCFHGQLLGLVPQTTLSDYGECADSRYFTSGKSVDVSIVFAGQETLLSPSIVFSCSTVTDFHFGVQVGGHRYMPDQPSTDLALSGATLLLHLSAEAERVTKAEDRRKWITLRSAQLCSAYILANAGKGESVSDCVFSGHSLIAEDGQLLCESKRFSADTLITEIDVQKLANERRRKWTENHTAEHTVFFEMLMKDTALTRKINAFPFLPNDEERDSRCEEILMMQSYALAERLQNTGCKPVVGLSGGLDSALAILVAARATSLLQRGPESIVAVTMPCFGTTDRTYQNACKLTENLGSTLREISVLKAVEQHFKDIDHNGQPDLTYENAQARERTQVLMDIANQTNGLVVGTGDLSELALGWATYNGDHMSMYGVNASIPKTLVRVLVAYEARQYGGHIGAVLNDILDTPVSPELLPPKNGVIAQKTESIVGNYDLHDFFIFYTIRYGFSPAKIYRMALIAFADRFKKEEIKSCLQLFIRRFFSQQFKRDCLPDGPKIGSVSFSPRGDWRMPSDACASLWLKETEML